MAKKMKRLQTQKPRNKSYADGMQELRRSNAAGAHRAATDYRRREKYPTEHLEEIEELLEPIGW